MKKIDIYVKRENDLIENYSANEVSRNLIEYLINKVKVIKRKEELSLNLYVTNETKGCSDLIREGLKLEYNRSKKFRSIINTKQLLLLLFGTILLFFSTFIKEVDVLREIVLIIGWVPIWEAAELEIMTDTNESKKRRCIKRLINCKFNEILIDK